MRPHHIMMPKRSSDHDEPVLSLDLPIDELKTMAQFIQSLKGATLEGSNMCQDNIEHLCAAEPEPLLDVMDKNFVKSTPDIPCSHKHLTGNI